jgi:multidrug efflux pump subunit AcrB
LLKLFGNYQITDIKKFGEITPIRLKSQTGNFEQVLNQNYLTGKKNEQYALSNFVSFEFVQQYKYITADQMGIYQSLNLEGKNPDEHRQDIKNWAKANNLGLEFFGQYFEDRARIQELTVILGFSVLILYFILAAQFESFVQPLIVIITLPLGVGGAFIFLALSGTSLNIMSAIGLVVMLGIMVNDAILKIDTINRLHLRYISVMPPDLALKNALKDAGEMRLKPILMTSLTTILALLPILFSEGLGADLQRPLVYSVLGGLSIGTLTALYFVPLAYYYLGKKAVKSLSEENLLEKSNT